MVSTESGAAQTNARRPELPPQLACRDVEHDRRGPNRARDLHRPNEHHRAHPAPQPEFDLHVRKGSLAGRTLEVAMLIGAPMLLSVLVVGVLIGRS